MPSPLLQSLLDAPPRTSIAHSSSGLGAPPSGLNAIDTFSALRMSLAAYLETPASSELWAQLIADRRFASTAILRLPRKETSSLQAGDARALVQEMSASGVHDRAVNAEDLALANALASKGWQGLLAAMLLVPAWQWPDAPVLVSVPEWLRADCVAWLFAAPQGFSEPGHAELYAAYTLKRLEELVRWINRHPGAAAEEEVLQAYARHASVIPLYFCEGHLKRHAELRGSLLRRAFVRAGDDYVFPSKPESRAGRRLRVGIVNRHFGPQTETYTTLPTFELLDPDRFEVTLFAIRSGDTALEDHCRKHVADFRVLPEDNCERVKMLRNASLDIVVFGTNVTAVMNEITELALHRVSPLQVVNNSSCITSGLPEIDLYVSGTLTETISAPEHFSERLALLPGPAHAFNYYADRDEAQLGCTRAEFGLPDEALVFVSAANYFKIIPEMRRAWAELLAAVPGSYLLVHPFNPNWTSEYPIERFRAEFERVLVEQGVDAARLVVSTARFPSRMDVKTLLSLGDVYLDTFPFGGVNSLVDPLELGLPVVVWEGETFRSRMGAALLRQLDLPDLIATNRADYHAIATKLAGDPAQRELYRTRIIEKMERAPLFLDPLAASEAFGNILETAYDELAAVGREAFRANREPLRCVDSKADAPRLAIDDIASARERLRSAPSDAVARHIVGRSLIESGRTGRAVAYLLAALQGEENNPELWLDVARALKADGQLSEALQALEAGLRLDQTALEGWVLFAELAHTLGSTEIAREAAGVVKHLAPDDSRVLAYL